MRLDESLNPTIIAKCLLWNIKFCFSDVSELLRVSKNDMYNPKLSDVSDCETKVNVDLKDVKPTAQMSCKKMENLITFPHTPYVTDIKCSFWEYSVITICIPQVKII